MGKVISVISGKGGTGKTTTVAAVSSCLAALGHKTLCIDCDAGLKNLDISLCMTDFAVADFADVLDGSLQLSDACREHPRIKNLFFLSAPALIGPDELKPAAMANLISSVRQEFEFCLIDAPSGIGSGLKLAVAGTDMAIIVATGEASSMRDAQRAAELASDMGASELRLLVNRVRPHDFRKIRATIDDVIDTVGARLIGVVCEDRSVFLSPHENTPLILYKNRRAAYHFLDAARRIAGEELPLRLRHFGPLNVGLER